VTARVSLLAAMLPLAAVGQLELTTYDASTNTETPIGSSVNLGPATTCQPFTSPEIRLRNIGAHTVQITTLEPQSGVIALNGAPLPPFPMAAGTLKAFYLRFAPTTTGTFTSSLAVSGTDSTTSTVYNLSVALTGTSVAAPTVTDANGTSYCPGGAPIYVGRTQVGTTVQNTITLINSTAATLTATVAGTDFGPTAPITVAAGATETLPLTFTPSIPNAETGTLTIGGLVYNLAGDGYAALLPQPSLQFSGNANQSSNQAHVSIPLAHAATSADAGTLTLSFQPAGNLPDIDFPATGGTRTMSVQVNPGDTAVHFQAGDPNQCTFQTGTTAGTVTFSLKLNASGVTASASTSIAAAPVSLDLSTAVPATDRIILSFAGFDNTHAASSLAFTFYNTSGTIVAPGLIQSNVTGAFASYYQTNPQAGGTFHLQATFPVTGDITQIGSVQVQFTNPAGVTSTGSLPVQ